MDRRDMLKGAAAATLAVSMLGAYDQKKIVNTQKMQPKDPKNPTPAELKHMPEIRMGGKDAKGYTLVEVTVGQHDIIHPSTADHWIYEIALFADGKSVGKVSLEPVISRGYLAARVKLDGVKRLSAVAKCNLHGDWEAGIDL